MALIFLQRMKHQTQIIKPTRYMFHITISADLTLWCPAVLLHSALEYYIHSVQPISPHSVPPYLIDQQYAADCCLLHYYAMSL